MKIGIIGFGNMGSAIAERIKNKYRVFVFEKDVSKTNNLSAISVTISIKDLVDKSDIIILAVKPQDFDQVLSGIKASIGKQLIVSIAAGITTGYIEKILGKVRVIRVMPNICARIGQAESSLAKGKHAVDADLKSAERLFGFLGKTWIMAEKKIDAATAISGSGPAYIFFDMEKNNYDPRNLSEETKNDYVQRLTKAAEKVGLDHNIASNLSACTTASSISLSIVSWDKGIKPAELKEQVTSKKGTTEAALKIIAKGGTWPQAAKAALKRARELAKK